MAGKNIRVTVDDSAAGRILSQELRVYPDATSRAVDLEISHGPFGLPDTGLVNPASHHDLSDGFAANFGTATVRWMVDNKKLRSVQFHVSPSIGSRSRLAVQRMRNIQFTLPDEAIGQIFHELVLIPSIYFESSQFLLHASGIQAPNGGVILIGGTGGVGKTSLALDLCRKDGFCFVTDDVAVVDDSGHVWPNLAYPKIYGYNLDGESELNALVRGGASWDDRLSWGFQRMRGADKVRRRMSPAQLYPGYSTEGGRLQRYLFIARELRRDLVMEPCRPELLASLSVAVMDAEYHSFHNHLAWHEMNRLIRSESPLLARDAVFDRWRGLASKVFRDVDCIVLRVPRDMPHGEFKRRAVELITLGETRM